MSASNKRLVAIVDSNNSHREKAGAALMSYYDLAAFENGQKALKALRKDPPALILANSDIAPGNAPDFIRAARENKALKDTPIVYIAESEVDIHSEAAKQAGADGVVVKPYPRSVLVRTISEQLNTSIEKEWEALPELQRSALQQSVGVFNDIADVLESGETIAFKDVKQNCQPLVEAIETGDFKSILDGGAQS